MYRVTVSIWGKGVRGYSLNTVCLDVRLTGGRLVLLNSVNFTGSKITSGRRLWEEL